MMSTHDTSFGHDLRSSHGEREKSRGHSVNPPRMGMARTRISRVTLGLSWNWSI
jgi:hypothetical protein